MKLKKFSFENKATGWKLAPMTFGEMNLLVGASGVGKSMILSAIYDLKRIANGTAISGIAWDVEFEIEGNIYRWCGEFETNGRDNGYQNHVPKLLEEFLYRDGELIIKRAPDKTLVNGKPSELNLSRSQSILALLDDFNSIQYSFWFIVNAIPMDSTTIWEYDSEPPDAKYTMKVSPLGLMKHLKYDIRQLRRVAGVSTYTKLVWVYEEYPELFDNIVEDFRHFFPSVESLRFVHPEQSAFHSSQTLPNLSLKEHGNKIWISQAQISEGMKKTLMFIADTYLWPNGTILLMDEFENSLGANCIGILEDVLDESARKIQLIITSHHPYVINNVPVDDWKLVTRKGNVTTVRSSDEFRLGRSKYENFTKLIQLKEYNNGIEA